MSLSSSSSQGQSRTGSDLSTNDPLDEDFDHDINDVNENELTSLLSRSSSSSSTSNQTPLRVTQKRRGKMKSQEVEKHSSIVHSDPEDDRVSTRKSTRYRWIVIFILSISGDGWSYEASVMSSVLNMPQFIARQFSHTYYFHYQIADVKRHGFWGHRCSVVQGESPHRTHLLV